MYNVTLDLRYIEFSSFGMTFYAIMWLWEGSTMYSTVLQLKHVTASVLTQQKVAHNTFDNGRGVRVIYTPTTQSLNFKASCLWY